MDFPIQEGVQQKVKRMIKGLEHPPYKERIRMMGLFSLFHEKAHRTLIHVYKYPNKECKEDGARLFSVVTKDRTGGNGHKLEKHLIPSVHKKQLGHCEGNQALERDAQEGGGDSTCGLLKTQRDTILGHLL